jgi:membrane protease subunit HflK
MNESDNQPPEEETPQLETFNGGSPKPLRTLITSWFLTALGVLGTVIGFLKDFFLASGENDSSALKDIRQAFANWNLRKTAYWMILVLLVCYGLSGLYVVNPGEEAVVKLFGKAVDQNTGEGLHYRLPWPIQTADVVNVSTIRREEIGLLLPEHESIHPAPEVVQFLSGDNNIIDIQAVIQYRVKDARAYLYNVNSRDYQLVYQTVRSAITQIGGGMRVDDILTIGKERMQELIRTKAQEMLDLYESGLQLVGINLNKVYPPEEVAEAFRNVSNAKQDREKKVNDAWGYSNSVLPQARGDADRIVREAEGYKIAAVNKARGEAGRFEQVLNEYQKDRKKFGADVTTTRLYLESMEKVLSRIKKYIINPSKDGKVNIRLFEGE